MKPREGWSKKRGANARTRTRTHTHLCVSYALHFVSCCPSWIATIWLNSASYPQFSHGGTHPLATHTTQARTECGREGESEGGSKLEGGSDGGRKRDTTRVNAFIHTHSHTPTHTCVSRTPSTSRRAGHPGVPPSGPTPHRTHTCHTGQRRRTRVSS